MKPLQRTALASVINLILLGMSDAHAADPQALEKRIKELESRLAKMDQLERRLEKLDQLNAITNQAPLIEKQASAAPEIEKLTKKVNTLQRKLEVQDEVTTGALSKIPNFEAGADGFKVTSIDKKHQLRVGGTVQTDYKAFLDNAYKGSSASAGPDSVSLRQARMTLDGYVYSDLYFKIMADFAQTSNTANLLPDAYLDYNYDPAVSLLVGKFKPSISLERLQGDADTAFLERGFPTNLAPNRDAGIQVHGGFGKPGYKAERNPGPIDVKNSFTYQVGISEGTGDSGNAAGNGLPANNNISSSTSTTVTPASFANDKEFDGRIFAQPFQHSGSSWLEGFGLGLAGSYSNPNHQAINKQTSLIGQSTIIDYTKLNSAVNSTNVITSNGTAYRIYPQAFWYSGPFGLMGEYVESHQTLNGSALSNNSSINNISQTNKASQVQVSYVVTGEDNTFNGVKPMRNFDPIKGSWGALQLVGRWSELNVDSNTFKLLDASKSVNKATAFTVGANWFLNKNALIRLDYEDVAFSGGAGSSAHVTNRPTEQIFSSRFQLAF